MVLFHVKHRSSSRSNTPGVIPFFNLVTYIFLSKQSTNYLLEDGKEGLDSVSPYSHLFSFHKHTAVFMMTKVGIDKKCACSLLLPVFSLSSSRIHHRIFIDK